MGTLRQYNQTLDNAVKELDDIRRTIEVQMQRNKEILLDCDDFNEYTSLSCAQLELAKRYKNIAKIQKYLREI